MPYSIGQDVFPTANVWLAIVHLSSGRPDEARRYARVAVVHAEKIGHLFTLSLALSMASQVFTDAGDLDEALRFCRQCIELCESQSMPFWMGWAMYSEGAVLVQQGHYAKADAQLQKAQQLLAATGARNTEAYPDAWRAIALAHLDHFDEARRLAEHGAAYVRTSHETTFLPLALYARGITEMLDPNAAAGAAEHWFNTAIAEARALGMRLMELRAANSLARLWQSQDKRHEARELLAPIYNWFTEGFDTKDLKEAKVMLDELS